MAMGRVLEAVVISALCTHYAVAQRGGGRGGRGGGPAPPEAPPPAGLECVDDLATPEFPKAALQAKVDGTVWFHVEVGPQGAAGKTDTQVTSAWADAAKFLSPPAEAALHAAKFKASCAGKTVLIVFRYELHGDPTANPQVTTRREANIVWIESQPMTAAPGRAGKK